MLMSSGKPLVSIVIPVLDDAAALTRVLAQLTDQDDLEVVVVDGGSQDESRRVAGAADRVVESASGRARQLKVGVAAARGTFIWMVHADSGINAELLNQIRRSAADLSVRWGRVDVRLAGDALAYRVIEWSMNWRSRLTGICTGDQGIFVRRELLELIGGMPQQALMEDIELCKKLRRLAVPSRLGGPIETAARRWECRGVLRTVLEMWYFRLAYFFGANPERLAARYYLPSDSQDPHSDA
jgi:rSAM/selenodomain-associated transferase 2